MIYHLITWLLAGVDFLLIFSIAHEWFGWVFPTGYPL
jgi:hypothetical protein